MASLTCDTHRFVRKPRERVFTAQQAEALADARREAERATGKDLRIVLAPVRADIDLMKRMMGPLLAGELALVLKTFFS